MRKLLALVGILAGGLVAAAGCGPRKPTVLEMEQAASARSPAVGLPAPDFTLPDQDDKPWALKAHRGRWIVLYFYPKDDTPGCICEATEFTELLFRFRGMNAEVVGVSEDAPSVHRDFAARHDLKITLLSDPTHEMMRSYGAWVTKAIGDHKYDAVIRTTYIIGPDGLIRWHWPEVIPRGHAERVRDKLVQLQKGS